MARLILVSNRVAIPREGGPQRAGGLEVALAPILKELPTVWFGWSGNVVPAGKVKTETVDKGDDVYVVTDLSEEDYQEYYNGFANRVLWPVLHYRIDLTEFTRRDLTGYFRVNNHFATELVKFIRPDEVIWLVVGDLSKVEAGVRELNLGDVVRLDDDGRPVPPAATR